METSCSSSSCTSCGIESAACPIPDRGGKTIASRARPPRRGTDVSTGEGRPSVNIPATQAMLPNPPGVGGGSPSTAMQQTQPQPPPPQPKLVPQDAVVGTPTISSSIGGKAPATTANDGKGLVQGSPEYCRQFPETELCRQGQATAPSPATPIYCGDPGAHPELCTERPVSQQKPAGAIGGHSERLPFFAPAGAARSLEECLIDFGNMTPERQIATIQASGPLATYASSSEAIVGIRNGRLDAADAFVSFMRTFRMGSPEITAFCAAVNRAIAPAGELGLGGQRIAMPNLGYSDSVSIPGSFVVLGVPYGSSVWLQRGQLIDRSVQFVALGGYAEVPAPSADGSAVFIRSTDGQVRSSFVAPGASIRWQQMAPVAPLYGPARPAVAASPKSVSVPAISSPVSGIQAMPTDGYQKAPAAYKGSGYVPDTGYHVPPFGAAPAWDARYSLPSPRLPAGNVQAGCISPPAGAVGGYGERLPFFARGIAPAGAIGGHSERLPFFAPAGAAFDHDGYLDLFVQLPPEAQANVLTSAAFGQGLVRDPYAHFLAGLLRRGELAFNGVPVVELATAHIKNYANREQAPSARGLIDVAIMQEGTAYGFVPAANNGFAPAGNPAPQANQPPPGFTPEQWGTLLTSNPEVAARLWTEFQQRPSTFSQVSGSIMQAANVVLAQLNANRAASLEERRADFAHQQAMARIQIDRENAAAQRLAATQTMAPAVDPATLTAQIAAINAATPPAAPQQPADPASMSTGAMAALGLGVVAIGGGGLYLATRKGGSRSARSNGFLDGLFGKSKKAAKKPSKKAR